MMLLALGVWAKQLTGSNTLAGLCTAVVMAPRLLGFLAGESLDRLPRRTALLGAELTTAGALAVLWLVQRDEQYVPLVIFGLVYGALGVLVYTASPGALKAITPKDEIPRAVSVLQVINGTVLLLGPISGTAVLATLGPRWLVVVTAGLFLIGALLLILVPIPRHDCGDVPGRWAGMRLLWSDPQLRVALVTLVMAYGVIGLVDGSLYALIDALHRPAQFAGVVLATQGIGMVVGAFVVPGLIARHGSLRCLGRSQSQRRADLSRRPCAGTCGPGCHGTCPGCSADGPDHTGPCDDDSGCVARGPRGFSAPVHDRCRRSGRHWGVGASPGRCHAP